MSSFSLRPFHRHKHKIHSRGSSTLFLSFSEMTDTLSPSSFPVVFNTDSIDTIFSSLGHQRHKETGGPFHESPVRKHRDFRSEYGHCRTSVDLERHQGIVQIEDIRTSSYIGPTRFCHFDSIYIPLSAAASNRFRTQLHSP